MRFSNHSYLLLIYLFCLALRGNAQVLNNKSGGICFRFDDNLPLEQLSGMEAVFNKHKVKYCLALNAAGLQDNTDYSRFIQKLDRDGFEIMDHCPNHCTNAFWSDFFFIYKNNKGVDHL